MGLSPTNQQADTLTLGPPGHGSIYQWASTSPLDLTYPPVDGYQPWDLLGSGPTHHQADTSPRTTMSGLSPPTSSPASATGPPGSWVHPTAGQHQLWDPPGSCNQWHQDLAPPICGLAVTLGLPGPVLLISRFISARRDLGPLSQPPQDLALHTSSPTPALGHIRPWACHVRNWPHPPAGRHKIQDAWPQKHPPHNAMRLEIKYKKIKTMKNTNM